MANNNMVHVFRWFWAWQDEDEEEWLRELSKKGLHLSRTDLFGSYTFTVGEPREYIYRLDFRNEMKTDLKSYYQLFEETGWEHVSVMGGWQYWRKPYDPAESVEIYSDPDSKIAKYQRLLLFLLLPLALILMSTVNVFQTNSSGVKVVLAPFCAFIVLFVLYNEVRVYQRIQQLKRL